MTGFLTSLAPLLFALINAVLVGVVAPTASRWFASKLNKDLATIADHALQNAIRAGISNATTGVPVAKTLSDMVNDPELRRDVTSFAVKYTRNAIPGVLEKLGVSDNLSPMISARLDGVIGDLAKSYMSVNDAINQSNVIAVNATAAGGGLSGPA